MPNDWTPQPPYPFDSPGKVDTPSGRLRRQLLKTVFGTLIVAALGILGWQELSPPTRKRSESTSGFNGLKSTPAAPRVAVGSVAELAKLVEPKAITAYEQPAFVEINNGHPCVLSAVCPHLGCAVEWQSAANRYVCPCHDSEFARDGSLLQGPSKEPLTLISSVVENGTVYVTG